MKVVVFGATGQLGCYSALALKKSGHQSWRRATRSKHSQVLIRQLVRSSCVLTRMPTRRTRLIRLTSGCR